MSRNGLMLVVGLLLIPAGCDAAVFPRPTSPPKPTPTAKVLLSPTATASPAPTPTTSPAPPATPPPPAGAWTQIEWRRAINDTWRTDFRRVVHWDGGYVGYGPGAGLFFSADGIDWVESRSGATRPGTAVVALAATDDLVVAMTLGVQEYSCCWAGWGGWGPINSHFTGPLIAWTTRHGVTWSDNGSPIDDVTIDSVTRLPVLATSGSLAVVLAPDGMTDRVATSIDGEAWKLVQPSTPPPALDRATLVTVGGGFLLTGQHQGGDGRAVALWTHDGRDWQQVDAFGERAAEVVDLRVAGGRDGVIVEARTDLSPGPVWWFNSTDGQHWRYIDDLSPLGVWTGDGNGSGRLPRGQLIGDGDRLIAYDTIGGTAGWTSFDGATWTPLTVTGNQPRWLRLPNNNLTLLPDGLMWHDALEQTWQGVATAAP